MGVASAWLAVREERAGLVMNRLGLIAAASDARSSTSIPTYKLSTGWRVLWFDEYYCKLLPASRLAEISKDQEVLVCHIEEHVMASSCELLRGGQRQWRIAHEGENGPDQLSTEGELPACFEAIRADAYEAQRREDEGDAETDYIFDVPLRVAASIVGFKHDEDSPNVTGEELVGLHPKKGKVFSADSCREPSQRRRCDHFVPRVWRATLRQIVSAFVASPGETSMSVSLIRNLDSFDIVGVRKDGGVDLVITCHGPLDNSAETLSLVRQKVENYVREVETAVSPTFFERYGCSPGAKINIYLSCEHEIHPDVLTVLGQLQPLVDRIGASIEVTRRMG